MDTKIAVTGLIVVSLAACIYGIYVSDYARELESDNNILLDIIYVDSAVKEASVYSINAEELYTEASMYYDYSMYPELIDSCEESRKEASTYVQQIRDIRAGLDGNIKIIQVLDDMLGEHIEIYNNLYEACEYFESAARCYDNEDFDCGGTNIDGHNKKIIAHDEAVNRHNDYLARYNKLIKELKDGDMNGIR